MDVNQDPPCSSDLAPSDHYLFPEIRESSMVTDDEDDDVFAAVDYFLEIQDVEIIHRTDENFDSQEVLGAKMGIL